MIVEHLDEFYKGKNISLARYRQGLSVMVSQSSPLCY